jgi:hypothetical protein
MSNWHTNQGLYSVTSSYQKSGKWAKPVTVALMTASPLEDWQSCSTDLIHHQNRSLFLPLPEINLKPLYN